MPDSARSTDPAVQAQLDRLWLLSPGADVLGLDRIARLLARLGDPHRHLPPVFHVAGTNGKGSTCAFLRAALEAAGRRVHVYTSPHLVRFNERIRIAGRLIEDTALALLLAEVNDHAEDIGASFFEVTTAAAFLAFARTPADACIVEVGLGGRLDATNVIADPLVTGIAQLGIDHQAFLGDSAEGIAAEKAGIAKPGVPLVTMAYPSPSAARIADVATAAGAPVLSAGRDWDWHSDDAGLSYRDAAGALALPNPTLAGPHQPGNLALATAMLRHQHRLDVPATALAEAARSARWSARMQLLGPGPLTARLPAGSAVWLDGGHNPAAGAAVAAALFERAPPGRPVHLIVGMLSNKDPAGLLAPFAQANFLHAVPVAGHDHHPPAEIAGTARALGVTAAPASSVSVALGAIADRGPATVLILGSLYLAGEVLRENGELPD